MIQELDKIDIQILKLLQKDANLNNKEIAFKLHKSVTTIHDRIRKLTDQGFIQRTVAILNRKKINRNIIAFPQVLMTSHTAAILIEFEREVVKFEEVMECFQMSGDCDFILRIASRDMESYSTFLRDKLAELPNVMTVKSSFVLREIKSDTAYPL
jgi:Lrp/AsnC family leucine-responsive transcriptional regulator